MAGKKTAVFYKLDDILEGLHPTHRDFFMEAFEQHVTFGDAKMTLVYGNFVYVLLQETASDFIETIDYTYSWTCPDDLEETLVAVDG